MYNGVTMGEYGRISGARTLYLYMPTACSSDGIGAGFMRLESPGPDSMNKVFRH